MDGNTALGASSPAKPALTSPEPLSHTSAVVSSSSHMFGREHGPGKQRGGTFRAPRAAPSGEHRRIAAAAAGNLTHPGGCSMARGQGSKGIRQPLSSPRFASHPSWQNAPLERHYRIPVSAARKGRESFWNRRDPWCPERSAGGRCWRRGRAGAGGVSGRELHGPSPGCTCTSRPPLPPVHPSRDSPVPSRPIPRRLPPAPRCRRATHQTSTGGGQRRRPWLLARRSRPDLYPPRGSVLRGHLVLIWSAPRHWAAAQPWMEPARPRPAPAHVRQVRGSAAAAAAWPNREPSAAPGGQRRRAGAGMGPGRGREGAAEPTGRLGPRVSTRPVPRQPRRLQLAMLGLGAGCEGSRTGVFSPGFSFFPRKRKTKQKGQPSFYLMWWGCWGANSCGSSPAWRQHLLSVLP